MNNFENDLMNLNDLRSLYRAMVCNGVRKIEIDPMGMEIEITPLALLESDLKKSVKFEKNDYCIFATAEIGIVTAKCTIHYNSKEYTVLKENGFALPEKEQA